MSVVRDIIIATRIHLPEASAASFRISAVENALLKSGQRIRVLTTKVPGYSVVDPEGTAVSRWPVKRDASGYVRGYVPYMSFDIPLFFRLLLAKKGSAILVEPPPTTGVVVRLAAALRRTPYVWYAADVWSDATEIAGAHPAVVRAVRWMESFTIRGAKSIIAVSEGVAERVEALGGRNIHLVPNGIDTDVFTPNVEPLTDEERAFEKIGDQYFLYAGTASEWQGAEVFAQAVALLRKEYPNLQVVYLGNGSSWEEIARVGAQILDGNLDLPAVVQHPLVPAAEAARWQRGALASLVSIRPGLGYDFAYPTKVLAALASGTRVLYAGVGPVVDDLRAYNLGKSSEHSPEAVAESIRQLIQEPTSETERNRLHEWVVKHRSMTTTGERAASVLRQAIEDA